MAYTPRLNDNGILNNYHWYSDNPFYQSGYGMPNCTCYAWGRFWEIGDPYSDKSHKPTQLPTGNGAEWWNSALQSGYYQTGQIPKLGAVACFYYSDTSDGNPGHVAIVEEIDSQGNITCSNSAYQSTYFYLTHLSRSNNYNYTNHVFQGFIYNPYADQPIPPTPTLQRTNFPWVLYARKLRNKGRR